LTAPALWKGGVRDKIMQASHFIKSDHRTPTLDPRTHVTENAPTHFMKCVGNSGDICNSQSMEPFHSALPSFPANVAHSPPFPNISDEFKRVVDELVDEFDDIYPIDTQHV